MKTTKQGVRDLNQLGPKRPKTPPRQLPPDPKDPPWEADYCIVEGCSVCGGPPGQI